jgi:basic membrane protein A
MAVAAIAAGAVGALVLSACGSAPEEGSGDTNGVTAQSQGGLSQSAAPTGSDTAGSQSQTQSESQSTSKSAGAASSGSGSASSTSSASSVSSQPSGGTSPGSSGEKSEVEADFGNACMVTDTGGVDDRSFNENSWKGVQQAAKKLGIGKKLLQSSSESDYVPNLNTFARENCGLIITVGALMSDATKAAAKKYPDQNFAIVDVTYKKTIPNVRGLAFDTSQSGFLAGYLAAGMSKTGKVAEFGGLPIPPVELYMDGFSFGVQHYNKANDANVTVLGWNTKTHDGLFAGGFTDTAKGRQMTKQLISQGADIIFPLAGNVNNGAVSAVQQADKSGASVFVIWVDTDGCVSDAKHCNLFVSSSEKHIAVAVQKAITQAAEGHFQSGNYVGTLKNNGVGLAPFHQFADKVPDSLKKDLKTIKQKIIDGKITIKSGFKPAP